MEVSGDILSTYLNKETLQQNQVFLLFEKILQEYFIIEYIPRKIFDFHMKNNSFVQKNDQNEGLENQKMKLLLPEKFFLHDIFTIFETLENCFEDKNYLLSQEFSKMISSLRSLCNLIYEKQFYPEVVNDQTNCALHQLRVSIRNKLAKAIGNKYFFGILDSNYQYEKDEKGFDNTEFIGLMIENIIESYMIQIAVILDVKNKKNLLEIAGLALNHNKIDVARKIYNSLSLKDKIEDETYYDYLKASNNMTELERVCYELIKNNKRLNFAYAHLIEILFHKIISNSEQLILLKQLQEDQMLHSLDIARILVFIGKLSDEQIIKYDISTYVAVIYYVLGNKQKAKKYFKYSCSKNKDFQTIIDQLNNE